MISVIIPIYNQEKYIKKCLESVLAQTYKDLQIILVNDGSTDHSVRECKRFTSDSRVILFEQENQGVSVARNLGIKAAKGEWIAFIDPDDYLEKDYFSTLLEGVNENTDIVSCCCNLVSSSFKGVDHFFKKSFSIKMGEDKSRLILQLMDMQYGAPKKGKKITAIGVPWGKLYRTVFIREQKLSFKSELRRMQDNNFNMYAFDKAREIIYINTPLYNYRIDNIENYYQQKYKPWLQENMCFFIKERGQFLKNSNYWKNNEIKIAFYNEVLGLISQVIRSGVLNCECKFSFLEKKERLLELIRLEEVQEVVRMIPLQRVRGITSKVIYVSAKLECVYIMVWIFKLYDFLRKIYSNLCLQKCKVNGKN